MLNGITGSIGLAPTLAALKAGRTLALANKESLIVGGPLVKALAAPGQIIPVDSEHAALFQALAAGTRADVRKLVVTASGGPFRGRTRDELADVTREQALAHPTWAMGPVITINSATLVNKGLEVIEAHLLYDIPFDRIEVVVHPQSYVHSMVEFSDGSTLAQATPPDMGGPIAIGLGWPQRVPDAAPAFDWTKASSWEFFPLDTEAFPSVGLARHVGGLGGTACGRLQRGERGMRGRFPRRTAALQRNHGYGHRCGVRTRHPRPGNLAQRRGRPRSGNVGPRTGPGTLGESDSGGARMSLTSVLLTVLGIAVFVVGLLFSIAWHELGHLSTAKMFGIRVPQYMVGFGPTIWSRKKGDTEYGIKAIPAAWLHPHDRDVPARTRRPPRSPLHLTVARHDRGRPLRRLRGAGAGRREAALLHAQAVEARHRDVRQAPS